MSRRPRYRDRPFFVPAAPRDGTKIARELALRIMARELEQATPLRQCLRCPSWFRTFNPSRDLCDACWYWIGWRSDLDALLARFRVTA